MEIPAIGRKFQWTFSPTARPARRRKYRIFPFSSGNAPLLNTPNLTTPVPSRRNQKRKEPMKTTNPSNQSILESIQAKRAGSTWRRAVKTYALELVEEAETPLTKETLRESLLNGAECWSQYSQGGCSLIYDADIAARLCPPSELKRKRGGSLQPSRSETWLDCQARALHQAESLVRKAIERTSERGDG